MKTKARVPMKDVCLGDVIEVKGRIGWRGYKKTDLRLEGPLVIGATQISKDHKLDLAKPVYLSKEKFLESPEIHIRKGNILLVKTGNTIGKVAIVNKDIGEACINPNAVIIRNFKCDNNYLYQYFTSTYFQEDLWNFVAVGAQPSVNQEKIKSIKLPLPPLPEQKKIAEILTSVDETIEFIRKVIDQTKIVKQGLLQELLTKGIGHTKFKKTEIGEVPDEWDIKSLAELVNKDFGISYGIVQTGDPVENGVRCIRVVDIVKRKIDYDELITTSSEVSQNYRKTILQKDDVMFALRGAIGHVRLVDERLVGCNLTRGIALIRANELVDPTYLFIAIQSPLVRNEILYRVNGSALQEIPLKELRRVELPLPCKNEQIKIASIVKSINVEIDSQENKLTQLQRLKKGLMQDLLTGKVRVKV
jgi:type I restriction enzyme, S subunit